MVGVDMKNISLGLVFFLFSFFSLFSSFSFAQVFENEQDKKEYEYYMTRKPDVVSEKARLEDYYVWDADSWIWKDDYEQFKKFPKGKVTIGKMTIRYIPD